MVILKLLHTESQVNHKSQPFWIKRVHLVPNDHTQAWHVVGAIRLAPTTTLHFNTVHKTKYRKIASSNTSRLEAHAGFFRLLMKGIFGPYVL